MPFDVKLEYQWTFFIYSHFLFKIFSWIFPEQFFECQLTSGWISSQSCLSLHEGNSCVRLSFVGSCPSEQETCSSSPFSSHITRRPHPSMHDFHHRMPERGTFRTVRER
jgi:hypothetical protein